MIRGYLKANAAISIGIAALLCLSLIGCVAQESPTAAPSDVPAFSEGEAIAIVQTLLIQGGCNTFWVGQADWDGEYLGDGSWTITSKGLGEWLVFEKTASVRIVKPSVMC